MDQTLAFTKVNRKLFGPCKRQCLQPDCVSLDYLLRWHQFATPGVVFAVGPIQLNFVNEYLAKYPMRELFLNVCGLMALWAGVAVVDVYDLIVGVARIFDSGLVG